VAAEISEAVLSASSGLVEVYKMATLAPASARPRATSRPIPRVPPVTRAVLPASEKWDRTGEEGLGCAARTIFAILWYVYLGVGCSGE